MTPTPPRFPVAAPPAPAGRLWAALRPVFAGVAHVLYRFRVLHRDRVPAAGPVLIASNHVTYLDWLLLWAASPRPLLFVARADASRNPLLRLVLRLTRGWTLVVPGGPGRPHATAAGLDRVAAALRAGRAVVLFPEGTPTRNGQKRPFGRAVERVLRGAGVPVAVVPAHLDNLWGTQLSWERGRVFRKWPAGPVRRRVAVYFGEPLPGTSTAAEIRAAVQECDAACGILQSDYLLPVHRQFVRNGAAWRNLRRTAFVDNATGAERRLSWPRALVGVWCLARWLRGRLGPEPRVGVWLPVGTGSALTNLALAFLGKTSVNLNYTAGPGPVGSAVKQAGLRTVITARRFLARVPLDLPGDVQRIDLEDALAGISARDRVVTLLLVLLLPGWVLDLWVLDLGRTKLDDVLTVLFSSGSTGEPKGVMLSHRNVAANVDGFRRGVEMGPGDRMLSTLPFFHVFGYTVCLWAPAAVGMEAVFHPDPRQAQEVGELCRRHRCTILLGTATFVRLYLRRAGPDDFRSLRLLICGAEKLPVKLADEFRARFGVLPLEGYGCTETSPVVCTNLHDVFVGGVCQRANTPGTVGQPIPNVCARAVDPETLAPVPPGVDGLLAVLGPSVMAGYLHRPDLTGRALRDGWYISGDVGRVEPDGFVRITGRVSRFAKIAGEMVPLERLDEELHDLLGTGGDRVLAVAAAPDERRGERVVVLHLPGVAGRLPAAFDGLRARGLPNLWVPDPRDCYPVTEFPALASGKLDLRRLGDLARELAANN